jgi:hypothetical protein
MAILKEGTMSDMNGDEGVDDDVIRVLAAKRDLAYDRLRDIAYEVTAMQELIKRYDRAIRALTNEPSQRGRLPTKQLKAKPKGIGPERMETIKDAVLAYAEDHEEFRQVDIRGVVPSALASSSVMAVAFEMLRQDNVIRLARKVGNQRYFRLTNAMLTADVVE